MDSAIAESLGMSAENDIGPGRPSKYRPEMNERVISLGKLGFSKAQIASDLDISVDTLDRWIADNREFADCMARARTHALAHWEAKAESGVNDRNFNALAYRVAMSGRFHAEYRETSNPAVSVTVNAMPAGFDLASLSAEDRAEMRRLLSKAKADSTPESTPLIEHKP